ncbi:MAG: hypothetical protein AW10_02591 [Candidatus Accumulibacter appositus]|uniref:Uncharacterized protein n=1 Tax=Candidatus Accumulibacter appositus TaxID=1454003 RepID=A0A011QJE1_9PROT|nr:hypothetical protein [Accumulibacter sp.]EXI78949.1 MAG: hypothetical protein AW10_02591 [Candidatus Accumulibacter appositus]HRF05259.1 hypothetical protein [Accumulibacter sp.]
MIKVNFKIALQSAALFICFISATQAVTSVCDIALQSRAFNTNDYASTSSIVLNKRDDACQSKYDSRKEAIDSARSSGATIGYGGFSFGASDARKESSGKWSISDSRFCNASAKELDSFTSVRVRQQVADIALSAWSECIGSVESNQLYATFSPNANGSGITGTLYRSVSRGGVGTITGIVVAGAPGSSSGADGSIVNCMIGTTVVTPNMTQAITIDRTDIAFQCTKTSDHHILKVAISTTQGDTPWMSLPAPVQIENKKIEETNSALFTLRGRIDELEGKVASLDNNMTAITALVSSHSSAVTDLNSKVSVLQAQPRFVWKKGNNGTVSCNTYCGDSKWEGFAGTCVSAAININDSASCGVAFGGPTHCLCATR